MFFIINQKPLPLFFIDLEPAINNKDIFELKFLCYTNIIVEAPSIKKKYHNALISRTIIIRHITTIKYLVASVVATYLKYLHKDFPAKCELFGDHPRNYKGCPSLKNIQDHRNRHSSQANKNNLNNNIRYHKNNNNVLTNLAQS